MFRLAVLLFCSIFVTLLIAGEDKGQMRPGLARAIGEGRDIVLVEPPHPIPVETTTHRKPESAAPLAAVKTSPPVETAVVETAAAETAPAKNPSKIFTLSALPGMGVEVVPAAVTGGTAPDAVPGAIRYVRATAVNVRQGPSAQTAVVDRLVSGEAVTVLGPLDAEWVEIVIEGDGTRGYVASRFLAPLP
ncbi:SH3 domain-containing protein [Pseudogemmobacter sonorensis]|uniref:SH3 domain-containing protein n=1 Tax=Pseudogemmobacter sonorensis TaxID=2989681 RepID=UPI0036CC005A